MSDPLTWEDPPVFNGLPAEDNLPLVSFPVRVTAPDVDPDDCEGGDTICVRYRAEWQPFVAGAISQLTLPSTWAGTYEEQITALNRAELLKWMLIGGQPDVGNCGCSGAGPLTRWTADGVLEVSNDGGASWSSYPQGDPRINGNYFPPLTTATGDVTKCAAAENVTTNFIGQVDQYADSLDSIGSLAAFLAGTVGPAIAVFLGPGGEITAFVTILAGQLFTLGATAVRAAFDDPVWTRFKCNLYCHGNADGSYSASNIADIKAKVNEDETGVTALLLNQMIDTLGPRGLTNAGRVGGADGDTCGDCDCSEPCDADCIQEEISIVNHINHDWPLGWSLVGDTYAVNDSTWNTLYPAYTGAGSVEIHFPPRCLTKVQMNYDSGTGTITVDAGDQSVTDGPGVSGTYVLEMDEFNCEGHITISGTDNTVQVSSITFWFCEGDCPE